MLKKTLLILFAGLISFALAFGITWFIQEDKRADLPPSQSTQTQQIIPQNFDQITEAQSSNLTDEITRQKLKNLIYNIREKMKEYDQKLENLNLQKERLQATQNMISTDIEQLNELKLQLNNTLAQIKQQQQLLEKSRVEIAQDEQRNLLTIAATYDKMDPASASKILKNMTQINGRENDSGFNDAVKILHYMNDRTKAKVLADMSDSEPELCAVFCQKLKHIVEKK